MYASEAILEKLDRTAERAHAQQSLHRRKAGVFVSGSRASVDQRPATFDRFRGLSPELNSRNDLACFLPTEYEQPRLAVLQNFKEINKLLRSNFLTSRTRRGLDDDEQARLEKEDEAAGRLTDAMKRFQQALRF